LRQVDIEIVFAVKAREEVNLRVQPKARTHSLLDTKLIHNRQHTRHARIDEAYLRIGLAAEIRGRAREELGITRDLSMNLKPND